MLLSDLDFKGLIRKILRNKELARFPYPRNEFRGKCEEDDFRNLSCATYLWSDWLGLNSKDFRHRTVRAFLRGCWRFSLTETRVRRNGLRKLCSRASLRHWGNCLIPNPSFPTSICVLIRRSPRCHSRHSDWSYHTNSGGISNEAPVGVCAVFAPENRWSTVSRLPLANLKIVPWFKIPPRSVVP